jgi:hypothetical protein
MSDGSAYPIHPTTHDARILRKEEDARARELSDLPDGWTDEELAEAESAYQAWLEWLDSPSPWQECDVLRKVDVA